jgi:putative endonuclease
LSAHISMPWFLYIVQCSDASLYTGITTDISRRLKEHNTKKGAFYTKNKIPVTLVYQEPMLNQSEARKREAAIKRLSRAEKLEFLKQHSPLAELTPEVGVERSICASK